MTEKYRQILDLLLINYGFDASVFEKSFFEKSVQKRMADTGSINLGHYMDTLVKDSDENKWLKKQLLNGFSEFFRNSLTFAVLEHIILPDFLLNANRKRSETRIWSAACAGGHEAYSIAILFEELKRKFNQTPVYRIFGTDRNPESVVFATEGKYPAFALKKIPLSYLEKWFNHNGDLYDIVPELKSKIDFSVFDLFDTNYNCPPACIFGDFDIIVCANLLFYYDNHHQQQVVEKISRCLAEGGFLVTGEAERDIFLKNHWKEVYPRSAIFAKKHGK
jgi:chemotaxis methyl-accepting protein methylase